MIESTLTIEAYLTDVTNEINCQIDVGKLFPDTVMSLADTIDQIHEFIYAGEYGLAYEYIIGLIDCLPFELSALSSLKFLEVALTFGYKTSKEGVFDAIFGRFPDLNSDKEMDCCVGLKWEIIERNIISVWCEIGRQVLKNYEGKLLKAECFRESDVFICHYLKKTDDLGYAYLLIVDIIKKYLLKISGESVVRLLEAALLLELGADITTAENQLR